MDHYLTGQTVRRLRERKKLTQQQLGEAVGVSAKAVSKWETARGLPDICLLEPLSAALSVSVAELLSGADIENRNRAGNMARSHFYVCPVCGNVMHALGEAAVSCCGVTLPPLEAEEADDAHAVRVSRVEDERLVTFSHPMEKGHYLSFLALVTADRCTLVKLYPEGAAQVRLPLGGGTLYRYCNRHGLYFQRL